jgi:predicted NAD/FAD-dependent oxidoreductase
MNVIPFKVAVIGGGAAALSCARHLQNDHCRVTVFDPVPDLARGGAIAVRRGVTICDIWYEENWRLASLEEGVDVEEYAALVLALPALQSAALLEPLLPATAQQVAAMTPAEKGCVWLPAVQTGVCGDWLRGGQEGDAWLSGRALAALVLSHHAGGQAPTLPAARRAPERQPGPGWSA